MTNTMEFHPVANIFPLLQGQEFEDLKADIATNGLIQPIWMHPDGRIIDGRNRWRACVETGKNADFEVWNESKHGPLIEFVVSLNLKRRHLAATQKAAVSLDLEKMLAERAKERMIEAGKLYGENHPKPEGMENFPYPLGENGKAREQAAALVGTNGRYVQAAKGIAKKAPELIDDMKSGSIKMQDAQTIAKMSEEKRKRIREKINQEKVNPKKAIREVEREIQSETIVPVSGNWLFIGNLSEVGHNIPDDSINLIFTDPPYDEQSVKLYGELAKLAARVLKPGGICLTYSGQMFLPKIFPLMSEYLEYMWLCGIGHGGGATWFRKWNLDNQWKPLLMYGKPPIIPYWNKFDDFISGGREKTDHEWQQALSEAEHYIQSLCPPEGVVLDPFLGSGTTLVAAKKCGMQFYGIEINPDTAMKAMEKIENATA